MDNFESPTCLSAFDDESSASASNHGHMPQLPTSSVPLWQLGKEENKQALKSLLSAFTSFHVTDQRTEDHLDAIRNKFEESKDHNGCTALHWTAMDNRGGDDSAMLLLSLGVDPSNPNKHGWTLMHACAWHANTLHPDTIRIVWMCRPKLDAENNDGQTLSDLIVEVNHQFLTKL